MTELSNNFFPFPEIPSYPGDSESYVAKRRDALPTAETTTLGNLPIVDSIGLTSQYINGALSLENVYEQLDILLRPLYPGSYQELINTMQYQQDLARSKGYTSARLTAHSGLMGDLENRYKPPKHFKMQLNFVPHSLKDEAEYHTKKHEYEQELRNVFRKGEKNVVFIEEYTGTIFSEGRFASDTTRFRGIRGAFIAAFFRKQYDHEPNLLEIKALSENFTALKAIANGEPVYAYDMMKMEVLDILRQEGYPIEALFENGSSDNVAYFKRGANSNDFNDFKGFARGLVANTEKRNQTIIEQISEVAQKSERDEKQSNIHGQLGTLHHHLVKKLPLRLLPVSDIRIDSTPWQSQSKYDELLIDLFAGKEINDQRWRDAFRDYRRVMGKL